MVGATVFFETALPPSTSILLTRQGRVGGVVFTKNKRDGPCTKILTLFPTAAKSRTNQLARW